MLLVAAWSYGTGKRHRRSFTSSQLSLSIEIQSHRDPYHTPIPTPKPTLCSVLPCQAECRHRMKMTLTSKGSSQYAENHSP